MTTPYEEAYQEVHRLTDLLDALQRHVAWQLDALLKEGGDPDIERELHVAFMRIEQAFSLVQAASSNVHHAVMIHMDSAADSHSRGRSRGGAVHPMYIEYGSAIEQAQKSTLTVVDTSKFSIAPITPIAPSAPESGPDKQEAPFECAWCGTRDRPQSVMQPAWCIDCVTATLQGGGDLRRLVSTADGGE